MKPSRLALLFLVIASSSWRCGSGTPVSQQAAQPEALSSRSVEQVPAAEVFRTVSAQLVYVPIYSHVYHGDRGRTFEVTATLSVRNADPEASFTLHSVKYHDTNGALVEEYLRQPRVVGPLATVDFVVEESDVRGGSGASFLVHWNSDRPIIKPVIEAIMVSTRSAQGLSFLTTGRVISEISSRKPEQTVP